MENDAAARVKLVHWLKATGARNRLIFTKKQQQQDSETESWILK
jgi:hypothetical protein